MRSARGRRRVWRAARRVAEEARDGVGETQCQADGWGRRKERETGQRSENTLHIVLHLPNNSTKQQQQPQPQQAQPQQRGRSSSKHCKTVVEETTAGVLKLKETATKGERLFPTTNVNDCMMEFLWVAPLATHPS